MKNILREGDFLSSLISDQPSALIKEQSSIYSPMIGSWNVKAIDYGDDGNLQTTQGEWHWAWVLEGRAIQDIWIAPARNQRYEGMSKKYNRFGTTIRVFDENLNKWKIFWFNPVNGARNELEATQMEDWLEHNGIDESGNLIRWTFSKHRTEFVQMDWRVFV